LRLLSPAFIGDVVPLELARRKAIPFPTAPHSHQGIRQHFSKNNRPYTPTAYDQKQCPDYIFVLRRQRGQYLKKETIILQVIETYPQHGSNESGDGEANAPVTPRNIA